MSKNLKKGLLLLILIMIPILALYGCGGNDEEEPVTETSEENEQEAAEGEEEEEGDSDPEESAEEEEEASEEESWEERDPESIFTAMEFPDNFSYNMTMESEEAGAYTVTYMMMGEKYRTEGEWEGQRVITIQDDEHYYFLDPEEMTAMRFPIDQAQALEEDSEESQFEDFSIEEDWERLELVGEETINGAETYIVLDQEEDVEIRMWIHKEYGIPMRIESSGPNPEDDYVMEVTNLQVGEVSEEDFEVPEDYEIMDFQN